MNPSSSLSDGDTALVLHVHHGGLIAELDDSFRYEGGSKDVAPVLDIDGFGYFELCELIEKLGCVFWEKIAYNIPEVDGKLSYLRDDICVIEMLALCLDHKRIDIYVHEGKMEELVDVVDGDEHLDATDDDWDDNSQESEYRHVYKCDTDDGLGDDELASDDEEYVQGRRNKAKGKAPEMLGGSVGDHYALLRRYQAELMRVDRGGKFEFFLGEDGCLKGFFVGFSSLTNGFLKGCRPVIGFDGCSLKTSLEGALLYAVGKDGNDQIYPICWAVVQAENEFFWNWFLELVFRYLNISDGLGLGWTFISEQQKGLLNVIKRLTPHAAVRNCARHVYYEWIKDHKDPVLKDIFWRAVRSTHKADFNAALDDLKGVSEEAYVNFMEREPTKWCKSFVSCLSKCDMVVNNVCETFKNAHVLKSRSKHIIDMLEDIRTSLMVGHYYKVVEMRGVNDSVCPKIRMKLEANKQTSKLCELRPAMVGKFEISIGEDQFVVDLNNRTCACRAWDISGVPCAHACKGITYMEKNPADYVHEYYSVQRYLDTYSKSIEPMNGFKMWPRAEGFPIKPPPFRTMPCIPKKKRKRAANEEDAFRLKHTKTGAKMIHRTCDKPGHNKRSCSKQGNRNQAFGEGTSLRRAAFGTKGDKTAKIVLDGQGPSNER